jgi:hypothetical protein
MMVTTIAGLHRVNKLEGLTVSITSSLTGWRKLTALPRWESQRGKR